MGHSVFAEYVKTVAKVGVDDFDAAEIEMVNAGELVEIAEVFDCQVGIYTVGPKREGEMLINDKLVKDINSTYKNL